MNITLIGMPGAGKSYVGARLAEQLGWEFLDLDRAMEVAHRKPLQQILDTLGEHAFLDAQEEDAIELTKDRNNLVISPGGSIVYTDKAMQHLKATSHIVYLEADISTILARINSAPRGIVGLANRTFDALYAERIRLYQKWASHTAQAAREPASIIAEILDAYPHLKTTKSYTNDVDEG